LFTSCKNQTPQPSDSFAEAQDVGLLDFDNLKEISGITPSMNVKDSYWLHNDGGDKSRIFLYNNIQKDIKEFNIPLAQNRDWEAIAITNLQDGSYLYLADIGDNNQSYEEYCIYRIKEPTQIDVLGGAHDLTNVEKISFRYPDGSKDSECLLIDHVTKDIFIITKRDLKQRIYKLPYPQNSTKTITAEFIQEVSFSESINQAFYITDGNISINNDEVLVKNYFQVFHWRKSPNESLIEVFKRSPTLLPYQVEPQGEALCFDTYQNGYFTVSEESDRKVPVHLYYYPRKK